MAYYMNQIKEVRRGDIFYIANSKCYATNPENEAGRPGIVVSCDELNENSPSVEVVYLTTKDKKPMPTHVPIMCKVCSTALCETIYTVGKDRLGDYVRTCTDTEMSEIDKGMIHSLGISVPYIERERLRKLTHRILPLPLSRETFIRICTNNFLTDLQRGDGICKSFLRHAMVV